MISVIDRHGKIVGCGAMQNVITAFCLENEGQVS